jgi:UDP-N-acetylglucosamine 2-epimerase (non-hydrolysing)
MIDTLLRHSAIASRSPILDRLGVRQTGTNSKPYGVLTLHRPSNVDDREILQGILHAVSTIATELPVFFPIHPRTRKNIESFGLNGFLTDAREHRRIIALGPLGYIDFLALNQSARIVMTDSGGIQEETTVLGVPCLTLRENTERPATVEYGTNQIVGVKPDRIISAAQSILRNPKPQPRRPPLWDGNAALRIVSVIREHLRVHRAA